MQKIHKLRNVQLILFSISKVAALQRFSQRLKGLKEVDDELAKWDLKFGNVCQFKGMFILKRHLFTCETTACLHYILDENFFIFRSNFTSRNIDFWSQEQENVVQGRQRGMEWNVSKPLSTLWTNFLR